MREIKFRGYSKLNNMWFYGFLGRFDNNYYIECKGGTKPFVEEDSIGQYTGFKDENDKEIYEGDIVEYVSDTLENEDNKVFIVEWETENNNGWLIRNYNYPDETAVDNEHLSYWLNDYIGLQSEVIGNIYERKLKEDK